jgi:DNA polymerase III epsilon subunit-like protein
MDTLKDLNIFFLDYETTGFNPYHNDVIEVAIKLFGSDSYYQTLIKPIIDPKKPRAGGIHRLVPGKIVEITGITDEMLIKQGINTDQSTIKTLEYILKNATEDKQPIYLVAHNGSVFDFLFLKRLIKEANISVNSQRCGDNYTKLYEMTKRFRYIDSCLLARLYMRDERVNQPRLCQKYNIVNDSEHRALGDILALEKLYIIMCQEISSSLKKKKTYLLDNPDIVIKRLMTE